MAKWKKVEDKKVRHIWKCQECDKPITVKLSPTFYEENGTPICDCGEDMSYIKTEILS